MWTYEPRQGRNAATVVCSISAVVSLAILLLTPSKTQSSLQLVRLLWLLLAAVLFPFKPWALAQPCTPALFISELMYNPVGGDAYEFIEIFNAASNDVSLLNYKIDGVAYNITTDITLQAGEYGIFASAVNLPAFTNRYPSVKVLGTFTGKLSNSGETISLLDAAGNPVDAVTYSNGGFWPTEANGRGYSLERSDFVLNPNAPETWHASSATNGTPGLPNSTQAIPSLHISEISSASSEGADWIELVNSSTTNINLSGWSISDDPALPRKFIFGNTILSPGNFQVLVLDTNVPFSLDSESESLFLFSPSGHRTDGVTWGNQVPGTTLARFNDTWKLASPTPAQSNQLHQIASPANLFINEWYAASGTSEADWIELHNRDTNFPASLTGLTFRTADKCFTLRGHVYVASGGFIRLWADEDSGANHLNFKLPASGGSISISLSNLPIHSITYPQQNLGETTGFLNDAPGDIVAFPGGGTPGFSNNSDIDLDGLPDYWERANGLNTTNALDAFLDIDTDGHNALQEYRAGTNPQNSNSVLRLDIYKSFTNLFLSFEARMGKSYSVLASSEPTFSNFTSIATIPPQASRVNAVVSLHPHATKQFYKIIVPALTSTQPIEVLLPQSTVTLDAPSQITLAFSQPISPGSASSNLFTMTGPDGHSVSGRTRFSQGFYYATFEPDLPLLNSTTYAVNLSGTTNFTITTPPSNLFREDKSVYSRHDSLFIEVNLTTFLGSGYTFEDVNSDIDPADTYEPYIFVNFQEGDYSSGSTNINGTLKQRGHSTRFTDQKSYKISLLNSAPLWRERDTINLNKHPYDLTRVRNKLAFDLAKTIPSLASYRTEFAHGYINSEDFGLYTEIEEPDTRYLRNHGLDPDGHLYKANLFEFFRYPEQLLSNNDPAYNEAAFENILEIKGKKSHEKLLRMLDEVNDFGIPINEVISRHFNRDNYLTWLAFNILTGNLDTRSQNFFLYSPQNSSTWYFLPWDYDGSFGWYDQPNQASNPIVGQANVGLANWWGVVLHKRFLQIPENVTQSIARVNSLATNELHRSKIQRLLDIYYPLVRPLVLAPPDRWGLPLSGFSTPELEYDAEFSRLASVVEIDRTNFLASLENPMPFFLGDPEYIDGQWLFLWDPSFDLQFDPVSYQIQISTSPQFEPAAVIFATSNLTENSFFWNQNPASGTYYWRVIARDVKGNTQVPFDNLYIAETDRVIFGLREWIIP